MNYHEVTTTPGALEIPPADYPETPPDSLHRSLDRALSGEPRWPTEDES